MRKIFTLFAAMLVALTVSAKVKYITPTSPYYSHSNLQLAINAAKTEKIDTIMLGGGVYDEKNNYLVIDTNLVILASDTASSVPVVQMYTYLQIKSGANVKIKGLKFDGAAQGNYDYYIRFYDNSHSSLVIDNCEFDSVKNNIFYCANTCHTDSLIINDCYFHNGLKSAIVFYPSSTSDKQTCDKLVVKNSTFANFQKMDGRYLIDYRNYGASATSNMRLEVDHCTFYNYGKKGSNYHAIYSEKSTNVAVSNCIFANDTITGQYATYLFGGTVKNCISYNLNNHNWGDDCPTFTDCSTANPLFVNAPAGNLALKGNWTTGEISPARGAGTDGSDLGDPRWKTAETIPNADLTAPYFLEGKKAKLEGNIFYSSSDSLYWNNKSESGTAYWKIHALSGARLKATVNYKTGSASGSILAIRIINANGDTLDGSMNQSYYEQAGDKVMTGDILIPEAGDYTIQLRNTQSWSSAKLRGITLSLVDRPVVKFKGGIIDDWVEYEAALSADKLSASYTYHNVTKQDNREFGVVVDGSFRTNKYLYYREDAYNPGVYGSIVPNENLGNMKFHADKDGDYTFTWFFENDSLAITFPEVDHMNGFYLVGYFAGVWKNTISDCTPDKLFALNAGDEYIITTELLVGDKFKAVYVKGDAINSWYPNGSGDEYVVDADHAGASKDIYFKNTYQESWGGYFYVEKNTATSIDETVVGEKAVKVLRNGQLFIEKDGKTYNVLGTVVK